MAIICSILLLPVIGCLIKAAESVKTSKERTFCLRCLLAISPFVYAFVFIGFIRVEPFNAPIKYSKAYMLFSGGYFMEALVLYVFSPFMWVITFYFAWLILRQMFVKKSTLIKRKAEFEYYRNDLDKIPPGIIMFTSELSMDIKRAISAGILKLKLSGHIEEKRGKYRRTNKEEDELFQSEKMLLEYVSSGEISNKVYRKQLEEEAVSEKYIVPNKGGIFLRIFMLIISICLPLVLYPTSRFMDHYAFENYLFMPYLNSEGEYDLYYSLNLYEDIRSLSEDREEKGEEIFEYHNMVPFHRFDYSVVRKAFLINALVTVLIILTIVSVPATIFSVFTQLIFLNKNYRRTMKGNVLLNKAYGLKNYLKEYSLMEKRSAKELRLWQYYMVYAVALDVNEIIQDEVMKKL